MHIERATEAAVLGAPCVVVSPCNANCAVIAVNHLRQITLFNPAAEIILGRKAAALLHQSLDLLPPPLPQILGDALAIGHALDTRPVVFGGTTTQPIHVQTVPLPSADGTPGVVAILHDMIPAGKVEQDLKRLERLASIGTLSASMAHETKNALVAVRTFVDLLIKRHQDVELAEIVSREMRRIDSIVSQMLRFAGPAKPAFAPVPLHDLLEQSLRVMAHQFANKNISVRRSFTAAPDIVQGDSYQLEQAFLNLFFNALEAMPPGGQLTLATELLAPPRQDPGLPRPRSKPRLRLAITDNGPGIPPENMARLFEPFFTTKPTGTGLGLPITKRIIQEHHGDLTVESQPGQGTTFTILLPAPARPR